MKTKKFLALLLCAMMVSALFACAQPAAPATEEAAAPAATEAAATEATEAVPAEKITLTFSLWGDPAEQETTQKSRQVALRPAHLVGLVALNGKRHQVVHISVDEQDVLDTDEPRHFPQPARRLLIHHNHGVLPSNQDLDRL